MKRLPESLFALNRYLLQLIGSTQGLFLSLLLGVLDLAEQILPVFFGEFSLPLLLMAERLTQLAPFFNCHHLVFLLGLLKDALPLTRHLEVSVPPLPEPLFRNLFDLPVRLLSPRNLLRIQALFLLSHELAQNLSLGRATVPLLLRQGQRCLVTLAALLRNRAALIAALDLGEHLGLILPGLFELRLSEQGFAQVLIQVLLRGEEKSLLMNSLIVGNLVQGLLGLRLLLIELR